MHDQVAQRTVDVLSGVIDLMREPSSEMPIRQLLDLLQNTFPGTGTSWNWSEYDGTFGMIMQPMDLLLAERETLDLWLSGDLFDCHALMTWFALTQDPAPFTTARVPTAIVPQRRRILVERPLRRVELEQQLSIVYRMDGPMNYAFVVARGGRDFDHDDLVVAGHVQHSVTSLDQQCTALSRVAADDGSLAVGGDLGLSGRELAVLQLVADGDPTRVVSRRLGCTPRTVEKHLENCYRKLEVRDRLNAVRMARLAGVLGPAGRRGPRRGPLEPGEFRGPCPVWSGTG